MISEDQSCASGKWLVVAAAFFLHLLHSMHIHLTAILLRDLSDAFELPLFVAGALAALRAGIMMFVGVLAAPVVDRFGCRRVAFGCLLICAFGTFVTAFVNDRYSLFLFYGVISAVGAGSIFIPTSVIVQQHFTTKRALAAGIASSGLSVGSLVSTPFIHQLSAFYGWRGAVIIVTGITVQMLVPAMLYFPVRTPPNRESLELSAVEDKKKESLLEHPSPPPPARESLCQKFISVFGLRLLSNRLLLLFLLAALPLECGIDVYIYLGISRAIDEGVKPVQASFVNSALGLSSFCGRILSGFVGSAKCINRSLYFAVVCIFAGVLVCLSVLAGSVFALHIAFTIAFGLFFGQQHSLYPTVLVDLVSTDGLPKAMGLVQVLKGISAFGCLPFSGWLYDLTGSFRMAFLVMGGVTILGGFIAATIAPVSWILKRRSQR
ncbi:hypothetical protein CAPTEDRAFT_211343 [Capitella teleta]|uniref:Major facilitator superfamily (MFS) profile domain-containing protein n=1 Tax=Capitella teleta TaxID=283909 RepID=R7TFH7_CAPTE|nr:hypothetical protein CAPTEDRAFT_211343 [Capitella teleta]|eukprot:ELT92499.1 hypothetical protein CAPTEDRAFT_211343 [Capitella teleta]